MWKNQDQYRRQLIAALEEQRTRFDRAVASLQESGRVLTHEETALLKPQLEILIRDDRADKSVPLPAILGNDKTVAVRAALTKPIN